MSCCVGVAREIKPLEGRFAINSAAPRVLRRAQVAQTQPESLVIGTWLAQDGCIETVCASTYDARSRMVEGGGILARPAWPVRCGPVPRHPGAVCGHLMTVSLRRPVR